MGEFDSMFSEFEDRKQREKAARENQQQEAERLRQAGIQVLRDVVLPVIEEIAKSIKKNGHDAEVYKRFEQSGPTVSLTFKPKVKGETIGHLSGSSLSFTQSPNSQKMEVKHEIRNRVGDPAAGSDSSQYEPYPNINASHLTQDQVRSHAMRFVQAVLKAN